MTLLLDHNLSYRLKRLLADLFDEILTLTELGMDETEDLDIWRHARARGWAMMSKDGDWADMALLYGAPPKVIRLRIGNGPWRSAAETVLENADAVQAFLANPESSLLVLSRSA